MRFYLRAALCTAVLLAILVSANSVYAVPTPSIEIIKPAGGETIVGDYNIDFNVSDTGNYNLTISIYVDDDLSYGIDSNAIALNLDGESASVCSDPDNNNMTENICRYDWNSSSSGLTEGIYYIIGKAHSSNGDNSPDATSGAFTIDNTPPSATNHSPANGSWSNNVNQQISVTLSDGASGVNENSIVLDVNGIDYRRAPPSAELMYAGGTGTLIFIPSVPFSDSQAVNISLAVSDNAGNWLRPNATGTVWSFTIDANKPIAGIASENPVWNNSDSLNVSCNDAASGCVGTYWYYFNDLPGVGSCSNTKADYVFSGILAGTNPKTASLVINSDRNNYICLWVEDTAGNTEKDVSARLRVDATKPATASDANSGWQTFAANVTLTCTDPGYINGLGDESGSGCANTYYRIDSNGAFTAGTNVAVNTDGNHQVDYYSVDNAGNIEAPPKTAWVAVDTSAPMTTDNAPLGWSKTDVDVTLTCTDALSGCASTDYNIDGGALIAGNLVSITTDGNHKIDYNSTDNVGNIEATKSRWVAVDKTAPAGAIAGIDVPPPWVASDDVTVSCADAGSGCSATILYYFDADGICDGSKATYTGSTATGSITVNWDESRYLCTWVEDLAGNSATTASATTFAVDATAPTTTSDANSTWQNFDANVHLTCADAGSGCLLTQFRLDANADDTNEMGEWQIWTDGNGILFSADGNWAIDFNSTDNAVPAHTEATKRAYVLIDKTAPLLTITSPSAGATLGSATVTLSYTGSDALSGISGYEVRADGGSWINNGASTSYAFTGQSNASHTYSVRAYDIAGNITEASVTVTVSVSSGDGGGGGTTSGGSSLGGGGGSGGGTRGDAECKPAPVGLGIGISGWLCAANEECDGGIKWNSPKVAGAICCSITCTEKEIVITAPPECAESGGDVCGAEEVCNGTLIGALDTTACCSIACEPKPQTGEGFNCIESGCDDENPCTVDVCSETTKLCSHTLATDGFPCGTGKVCKRGACVNEEQPAPEAPAPPVAFAILGPAGLTAGLLAIVLMLAIYALYRKRKSDEEKGVPHTPWPASAKFQNQ